MWTGVISGFAGMKFSKSTSMYGLHKGKIIIFMNLILRWLYPTLYLRTENIMIKNPIKSLEEYNGWKGLLSILLLSPRALFDTNLYV